jgi:dTDP-glucose 4,6-dehydratase
MKSCLVIGSNSFSGSNFINFLLDKKIKVFGISRSNEIDSVFLPYKKNYNIKNYKFYKINIKKNVNKIIKIIKKNKIQYIINFASQGMVAESWISPLDWYETNTLAQIKLFESLKKIKFKKYMHVSTPEVYGDSYKKITEGYFHNPSTPYAISRSATDLHLIGLSKFFNFPVVFSRAANVYGPGQQLYRIVPKTIMCVKKKIKINVHGGGSSKRSFIHINDATKAYFDILEKGKIGSIYHVSNDNFLTIKNLVKIIIKTLNKNPKKFINLEKKDRTGKDSAYFLDSKKIIRELKFKPKINLMIGIKDTINWVEKNFSKLKKYNLEYKHKK